MNRSVLRSRNRLSQFRRRPLRSHPYRRLCDRRPKIVKPGSVKPAGCTRDRRQLSAPKGFRFPEEAAFHTDRPPAYSRCRVRGAAADGFRLWLAGGLRNGKATTDDASDVNEEIRHRSPPGEVVAPQKSVSQETLRWRGMDSKIQFRDASPPPSAVGAFIRR